jgi:hypothetical protein
MRAVAKAMRPYGTTVAFHSGEIRLGWFGPWSPNAFVRLLEYIPRIGFLVSLPIVLWNLFVLVVERVHQAVQRSIFKLDHVHLVDSQDDRWKPTFRRLAYHSQLIVMDLSMATAGVEYEAEFLSEPGLARRLIVIHDGTPAGIRAAEQHIDSLRAAHLDLTVPVVPYDVWHLRRLTARLGELSSSQVSLRQTRGERIG